MVACGRAQTGDPHRTRDHARPEWGSHSRVSGPGMNPKSRHVPQQGIEPTTLQLWDDIPTTEPHQPGLGFSFNWGEEFEVR